MYSVGDVIDGRYRCTGICNDAGGMGCVLFVEPLATTFAFPVVLKYCRDTPQPDFLPRFKREVRLLLAFQGNSKVVDVVDHNIDHTPPYFVMRYYPQGDLLQVASRIQNDAGYCEQVFLQMIDCIAELHAAGKYHRDIKPQNFLVNGESIVVSDFGVSKELNSETGGTKSSAFMGTVGYLPPEFIVQGGFKNADAAGDVFMLGKSFYVLLSGRDPRYPSPEGVPEPLWAVIERCGSIKKENRYSDLGTLKQRLTAAFDVILGRKHGPGEVEQLLAEIQDRIEKENKFTPGSVERFVDLLQMLQEDDRTRVLFEAKNSLFRIFTVASMQTHLPAFLNTYRQMVERATYSWSYAEVIADNMKTLFESPAVGPTERVLALELAIIAAERQNRYAAMDTCRSMILSVRDEGLGMRVAEMLSRYLAGTYFIANIEPASCATLAIRGLLEAHKRAEEAAAAAPASDSNDLI